MRPSSVIQAAALSAVLAMGAGATDAAGPLPLTVQAPHGFDLRGVEVKPDGGGLRLHGRLCRNGGVGPWPSRVRLELLSRGEVAKSAVSDIGPISARTTGCVVYTVKAPWRPGPGQTIRLSADPP